MALKKFKPYTPSNRYKELPSFEEITKDTPEKSLLSPLKKSGCLLYTSPSPRD